MPRPLARALGYALLAVGLTECSEPIAPTPILTESTAPSFAELSDPTPYPVLAGAGDIANCRVGNDNDESTARLLDAIFANGQPGNVMMLGEPDEDATPENYPGCYVDTWGRHLAITRPMPGNKDYINGNIDHYFRYFGAAAGEAPGAYYSFDVGAYWHVVVINSNSNFVPTNSKSAPQVAWLRNDLLLNTKPCIAAFMHHPRFFSSTTPNVETEEGALRAIWDELYKHGAEFVASGNKHHYERLKPMRADGTVDVALGVRQFIVGTGGTSLGVPQDGIGSVNPNTDVRGADYGVVKFTLKPESYDWQFVPARNRFNDAGSTNCHPPTIPVTLEAESDPQTSAYGQSVLLVAKAEDGSNTVRVGTMSFIMGGTCEAPGVVLASDLSLDVNGRASTTISTLDVAGSPHSVTACYTGDGSYMSATAQLSHSVTKAVAEVGVPDQAVTFDGAAKPVTVVTDPPGLAFTVTYTDAAGEAVGEPIEAGTFTATATIVDENHRGTGTGIVLISPATPVIAWDPAPITYGTPLGDLQLNATASFNGQPVAGTFTYAPPAGTVIDAGSESFLVAEFTPSDTRNFLSVTATVFFPVGTASQTISFTNPGDRTFGDPPFEVSTISSSGLPVSVSAVGACSVAGTTVTILQAGSCSLTASQGGNANFQPAADVTHTISIAKKIATVTLGGLFHNYSGQPISASASTNAEGQSAFSFEYRRNGIVVAQPTEPGSYGVVATLVNANYRGSASGTLVINALPVTRADAYSITEDGLLTVAAPGVTGNDSDADGTGLTASLVSTTPNGTLQLNPDGSFAYAPRRDFNGTDAFSYRVTDGHATSAPVTVTIHVTAVNDAPAARAENYSTPEDQALQVPAPGVLGNDSDVDAGQTLQAILDAGPTHGTLTLNANGSFTYRPAPDYHGSDAFTYRVSDGTATSAATVTLTVTPVAEPVMAIKLDILPGSTTNTTQLGGSQTQIVFALISSPTFDAAQVDPAKVTIGNTQGAEAPLARNTNGTYKFMLLDVSGDGRRDFYAYVNKADLRNTGDLTLATKALTVAGALKVPSTVLFAGTDKVNVIP